MINLVAKTPETGGAWTGPAGTNADRDWSGGKVPEVMPGSAIVLGDFNMIKDSDEYQILAAASGLDNQPLLIDAYSRFNAKQLLDTWHPNPGRDDDQESAMLDYIFLTPNLLPSTTRVWVDEQADGSDHQPVWLDLE